jgi:hypothetical protein
MTMDDSHPSKPERRWYRFSLRTLLLLTTLVAVSLGLIQTAVLLGTAFMVASLAALVRTVRAAAIAEDNDPPMSTVALIGTFANSFVVVTSIAVAWLFTLVIACLAAALLAVIALASMCRILAAYFARISQGARWLERLVLCGIAGCNAVNGVLHRRFWLQCS